jgi:hypothetical protein
MDYAKAYGELHANDKRFPGYSIGAYTDAIRGLVEEHKPERLLDFGSGKGFQYLVRRVHERWGGLLPYCYDVGVRQLSELPEGTFGGVLCTDVLEHIDEPDVPAILDTILSKVEPRGFVLLGISCRPTKKTLPDGRDVHLTIQPPSWWVKQIEAAMQLRPVYAHVVAHWDINGHFDEPETPWDSCA